MPCVALAYRKIYRAKMLQHRAAKPSAREKIAKKKHAMKNLITQRFSAQKTAATSSITPETVRLADFAVVAITASETIFRDGDRIQIRSPRARSAAKLSRLAVWKSSRALKKLVKSQDKTQPKAPKLRHKSQPKSTVKPQIVEHKTQPEPTVKPHFVKHKIQPKATITPLPITPSVVVDQPPMPDAPVIAPQAVSFSQPTLSESFSAPKPLTQLFRPSRADLINAESRLGSTIFGPIPAGRRREFFHDRDNIWIWHESWTDAELKNHDLTVRYEARPSGIYKKLAAGKYFKLEGAELENFLHAARTYLRLIKQHIYHVA